MIFIQLLRNGLETILNRIFYHDSSLKEARIRLCGKVLQIKFDELSTPITFLFSESKINVLTDWQNHSDCIAKIRLALLPKLYNQQKLFWMISNNKLEINGDVQVIQYFSMLINIVNSDLSNYIAPWVGDVLAHSFNIFIQKKFWKFQKKIHRKQFNLAEALIEEWKLVINPLEITWYSKEIQKLERHISHIEKRLQQMEMK